jgi:galactokinase
MPLLGELLKDKDACVRVAAGQLAKFGLEGDASAVAVYVPGRVEFLGKHTDYAGGRSLLLAVDRGFRLLAVPRQDNRIRVWATPNNETREFVLGETPHFQPGHWVNYVATVASRMHQNFDKVARLRGADIALVSDLPIAAGMSSSSALMVAVFLGLSAINGLDTTEPYRKEIHSTLQLAEYLGCVENGQSFGSLAGRKGVGTFGGSEDHTSMLCCKPGMLSQFSFAPAAFERDIPWPPEQALVIGCCGVEAVKTGAAMADYNRASLRARQAAAAYNAAAKSDCRRLRDVAVQVGPTGLAKAMEAIARGTGPEDKDQDLPGRFEQFFHEDQEIIPQVGDALAGGKVEVIGPLVDASHEWARRGLQNQIDQTNFLQASARRLGAAAASAFGAGFGGSVWAMAPRRSAQDFAAAWKKEYLAKFPSQAGQADIFVTFPGRAAEVRR